MAINAMVYNLLYTIIIVSHLIVLFTHCTVPVQCTEQLYYFPSISSQYLASSDCVSGTVGATIGGFIGGVLLTTTIGGSVSLVVLYLVKRKLSALARQVN